jgi:deaminated glutathione amidase
MLIAAVQINARQDEESNIIKAFKYIDEAADAGAKLVALPECFHFMGPDDQKHEHFHAMESPLIKALSRKAAEHRIYLLGGSILQSSSKEGLCSNTSTLFGPDGSTLSHYSKIHLFDVNIPGSVVSQESKVMIPGKEIVLADTPHGKWGMTICYDLRFPELYRKLTLQGAELIFVTSAFALHTGKDHWEPLLRARAIENQVYIVAPNQTGCHFPEFSTYGNSMIIDPWGNVIARANEEEGIIMGEYDRMHLQMVRQKLPSLEHRAGKIYDF